MCSDKNYLLIYSSKNIIALQFYNKNIFFVQKSFYSLCHADDFR